MGHLSSVQQVVELGESGMPLMVASDKVFDIQSENSTTAL
jgi:hypothetical protein